MMGLDITGAAVRELGAMTGANPARTGGCTAGPVTPAIKWGTGAAMI